MRPERPWRKDKRLCHKTCLQALIMTNTTLKCGNVGVMQPRTVPMHGGQTEALQARKTSGNSLKRSIRAGMKLSQQELNRMRSPPNRWLHGISNGLVYRFRAINCQKPRSKASRKCMLTTSVLPPTTTGCHQRVHSSSEMPYTTGLITTSVTKDFKTTLRYDISHIRLLSLLS